MIYIILILYIIFLSVFFNSNLCRIKKEKKVIYFYNSVFFFLAIIMGLRSESVGVDTKYYKLIFDQVANTSFFDLLHGYFYNSIEIGYVLLMKLLSCLINNYYFFQIVISFLFCYQVKKFLINNSNYPLLGVLIFVGSGMYLNGFNVTRQMIAAVLLANAWNYLIDSNLEKCFLNFIFAISFHFTSIIFLLFCFIYKFSKKKNNIKKIIQFVFVGAINYQILLNAISLIITHYHNYMKNAKVTQTASGVIIIWAIILIIALYIVYIRKNSNRLNDSYAIFSIFYVLSNFIGLQYNYFERIGLYFLPFTIILFECVSAGFKNRNLKFIYNFFVGFSFMVYFLLSALTSQQYSYLFFWQ